MGIAVSVENGLQRWAGYWTIILPTPYKERLDKSRLGAYACIGRIMNWMLGMSIPHLGVKLIDQESCWVKIPSECGGYLIFSMLHAPGLRVY